MNISATSKQLSKTNSVALTKGTTAENTTTVTPLSSHVTSSNASSVSAGTNDLGMTSLVKASRLTVKYGSKERSRDVLLSPGAVAVIAFAIAATAVVFIFLVLGIRRKRWGHRSENERSLANSSERAAYRTTSRYVAGDSTILDSKADDATTFQPMCPPDDGDKCDTLALQGVDTAPSSAIPVDAEVYGSPREPEEGDDQPLPSSPEVTDAREQSRRRHQGADANDVNTASHFDDI